MAHIGRTDEIRLRWTTSDLVLCTDDRCGASWPSPLAWRIAGIPPSSLQPRRPPTTAPSVEGTHLTVLSLVMSGGGLLRCGGARPRFESASATIAVWDGTDFGVKKGPFLAL